MHVVVINVESLFSISAATAAECCMENLPLWRRRLRLGDNHNHFGVRSALLEKATDRNKIKYLADIPTLKKFPPESKRLLVVEKAVLLEHGKHAAALQYFHGLVQEKISDLLVRQVTVFFLIANIRAFRAVRGEFGCEGRVADTMPTLSFTFLFS